MKENEAVRDDRILVWAPLVCCLCLVTGARTGQLDFSRRPQKQGTPGCKCRKNVRQKPPKTEAKVPFPRVIAVNFDGDMARRETVLELIVPASRLDILQECDPIKRRVVLT